MKEMKEVVPKIEIGGKDEGKIITYLASDGQEVKLSLEIVKKYLVHGDSNLVTAQELMYFINICRSRKLNPLTKDCYLIKYGNEPAAIVTSIDFFRKRARAQPDCVGWEKGVIVKTKDGHIRYSHGFIDEDEKLVGGWFEAQPKGWAKPFRLEVNLSGYIKKTKEGRPTRFWAEENQPTMIAKVAEAQGLRTLWPNEFHAIFTTEEEVASPLSELPEAIIKNIEKSDFDELVAEMKLLPDEMKIFEEYCEYQAKRNNISIEQLKKMAASDFDEFIKYFETYKKKKEETDSKEQEQRPLFQK